MTIDTSFELRPLRRVARVWNSNVDKLNTPGEASVRLCNYVDVYRNDIVSDHLTFMRATASGAEIRSYRLQIGDVLLTKDSELWTDIGVPALVAVEDEDLLCGYHLSMLRPFASEIRGAFLARALRVPEVANQLHVSAKGVTRYGLTLSAIRSALIPVPDLEIQEAIVRYLDHAEMRIAKAIAGKNEVLVKLREAKTAVVGDLILGQSGGDDELVTTDLGPIPADWQRISLRGLLRPRAERNRPELPLLSVVRSKGVVVRSLDKADNHNFIPDDLTNYKVVQRGDLAINKMKAWSGSAGVAEISGIVSPAYFVYQFIVDVDPAYMNLLFRSPQMRDQFARASRGVRVGQWDLSPDDIKSVVVGVPPMAEQQAIASKINERTAAIDTAMAAIENEIALLKEYRVRLISDVVTGKLDVRAEAASLPDVDPAELAAVLAGGSASTDEEEGADGDD